MVRIKSKLVYSVGVNDADYAVANYASGKQILCPFYLKWRNMLRRCYSPEYKKLKPTYIDCTVCDKWLNFSEFKAWMEKQDWKGNEIDKDLLFVGNKIYSPDTCAFVDGVTNKFITDRAADRGACAIGVYFEESTGIFQAYCNNPFTKKQERIGRFKDEISAHLAWKKRKHELACQLAELQTDERVAAALRVRYL